MNYSKVYNYLDTVGRGYKPRQRGWGGAATLQNVNLFLDFTIRCEKAEKEVSFGLLCQTASAWQFFPVWVKLVVPQTVRDKSDAVLKRICAKISRGLILFDRGFHRRKVFTMALGFGHHILCRAKSNAVFYRLPKHPKRRKPGCPRKYGARRSLSQMETTSAGAALMKNRAHSAVIRVITSVFNVIFPLLSLKGFSLKCSKMLRFYNIFKLAFLCAFRLRIHGWHGFPGRFSVAILC